MGCERLAPSTYLDCSSSRSPVALSLCIYTLLHTKQMAVTLDRSQESSGNFRGSCKAHLSQRPERQQMVFLNTSTSQKLSHRIRVGGGSLERVGNRVLLSFRDWEDGQRARVRTWQIREKGGFLSQDRGGQLNDWQIAQVHRTCSLA